MKKLITFRFDPELLADARKKAQQENRTLTNFVETVLKKALETETSGRGQPAPPKADPRS